MYEILIYRKDYTYRIFFKYKRDVKRFVQNEINKYDIIQHILY